MTRSTHPDHPPGQGRLDAVGQRPGVIHSTDSDSFNRQVPLRHPARSEARR